VRKGRGLALTSANFREGKGRKRRKKEGEHFFLAQEEKKEIGEKGNSNEKEGRRSRRSPSSSVPESTQEFEWGKGKEKREALTGEEGGRGEEEERRLI